MCSHLFGSSSGGILGAAGDIVGGLAGAYFGGPVGAAAGAELGGTVGGVAGGESVGTAALNALPAAGIAGVGDYAAEAFAGATPAGGTDLFGVSGTPAAPAPAAYSAGIPAGDVTAAISDTSGTSTDPNGYIDPTTGLPVPPQQAPLPGAVAPATAAITPNAAAGGYDPSQGAPPAPPGMLGTTDPATGQNITTGIGPNGQLIAEPSNSSSWTSSIAKTLGIPQSSILPAGVAGIGLAKDLLTPSTLKGESQLTGEAATLAQQSATMQNYLNTGTLPPGVQTAINNATQGAAAAIRAKYASQGLSGSSMEQQEINQLQLNAASSGAQVAIQLYDSGLQDANISQEIYKTLLSTDVNQQQQTGQAIANVAAALSGGIRQPATQPTPVS
jgi:hypothetical protein